MNKNYTLKELADIGAKAAGDYQFRHHETGLVQMTDEGCAFGEDQPAREAFTQAILSAIGYEFPKDEEREAFDAWWQTGNSQTFCDEEEAFKAWKAGREELRRATAIPVCAVNPDAKPKEPAWIPWDGGECPLADGIEFEFKRRDGFVSVKMKNDGCFRWKHLIQPDDIVAYRVLEG